GQETRRDNVVVDVSARLLNAALAEPVKRVEPVREYLLETDFRGMGWTQAQMRVALVPNDERAALDLVLSGTIYSQLVGTNESSRLYVSALQPFEVRKQLLVDQAGIHGWPSCASVQTISELCGVTDWKRETGNLTAHLARRMFYADKCLAEDIISGR